MNKSKLSSVMLVLFVLSAFGAVSTFMEYAEPTPLAYALFIWPVIFGVITWRLRVAVRREQAPASERKHQDQQTGAVNDYATPQKSSGAVVRATSSVVTGRTFSVAGVTFNNDDGSSRQEILRDLFDGPLEGETDCWFEPFLYQGEMALRVKIGDKCVGNVRKSDVQTVIDCIKSSETGATLQTDFFENDDGEEVFRADYWFDDLPEQ